MIIPEFVTFYAASCQISFAFFLFLIPCFLVQREIGIEDITNSFQIYMFTYFTAFTVPAEAFLHTCSSEELHLFVIEFSGLFVYKNRVTSL